jgi:hypothetical protein
MANRQNSDNYPVDWPAIARAVKESAGFRCQQCDKQCRRPGEMHLGWQYELTVAHLDHGYEAAATTVAALCIRCHFAYDAPRVWVARRRALCRRLLRGGQLAFSLSQ